MGVGKSPRNLRTLGPRPLGMGRASPLATRPLACVTMPNLVILNQTAPVYQRGSTQETGRLASRFSRSLKVIETDTDRSATYDCHSSQSKDGPLLYRFQDIAIYLPKIAKIS